MNTRLRHMDNHQNLDTLAKTVQTNTQTVDLSVPLLFLLSLSVFLSALEPWRQTQWQGQGVLVNELWIVVLHAGKCIKLIKKWQ